jgi:hypothetical protein
MEPAAPNALGMAFHWIPARQTEKIAAKTLQESMAGRSPLGFRRYCPAVVRPLFDINGFAASQNASVVSHGCCGVILSPWFRMGSQNKIIWGQAPNITRIFL